MTAMVLPRGEVGRPQVTRAAMIGLGVIGTSWTALHLARGIDVVGFDAVLTDAKAILAQVDRCRPALEALGLTQRTPGRFSLAVSLEEAVGSADFVQESAPENLTLKTALYRQLDAATAPDVIIASSTSSIPASQLQRECTHPNRILVGHPFTPAHIMPLVEIAAGAATCEAAPQWLKAYYRDLGKRPIILRTEVPGFIANRFQTLVFEEALSLIQQGVATAAEIDEAFVNGIGLRWALYGPIALVAFSAGRAGIGASMQRFEEHTRRVLASVRPSERGPELIEELERQTSDYQVSKDPDRAIDERDRRLVELIMSGARAAYRS